MDRIELEKILWAPSPDGPFKVVDDKIHIYSHKWLVIDVVDALLVGALCEQLNKAFQLGRWIEHTESEPPLGKDSDYQPICKFCGTMTDEMVTVHFKQSSQRMCVACMNDKSHRKL